jgi:hypothetical protein
LFGKDVLNALPQVRSAFNEVNDDTTIDIDPQRYLLPTLALCAKLSIDVGLGAVMPFSFREFEQYGIHRGACTAIGFSRDDDFGPAGGDVMREFDCMVFSDVAVEFVCGHHMGPK